MDFDTRPIAVGDNPLTVLFNPDDTNMYVTANFSKLSVIDSSKNTVIGNPTELGDAIIQSAFSKDNHKIYGTVVYANKVIVITVGLSPNDKLPPPDSLCPNDGKTKSITGTGGDDTLIGNPKSNIMIGLGGDDKINGCRGDDIISGGKGNDAIAGSKGNDIITGEDGNDFLDGSKGNDKINGGKGDDTLAGGEGKDAFKCGQGKDAIIDFNAKDDKKDKDCESIQSSQQSTQSLNQANILQNNNSASTTTTANTISNPF